ncbi:unnamed protein product [Effrenium voratum]|uniref:AP complex mu/sigma subunit domain-containing protein n=1 Tax=Effrenium voratum TaxID=2562239 RepID=A0AA36MPX3_9DINO|nr:unnamed protein product [Effrenium voratum]
MAARLVAKPDAEIEAAPDTSAAQSAPGSAAHGGGAGSGAAGAAGGVPASKSWNRAIIQTRLESLPPNFSTTQLVSISCAYGEDSGASFVARRFKLGPSDQSLAGEAQLVMLRGNSNSMEVEETASSVGCYRCELRSERPVLRLELRYDSGAREEMELPLSHALDGRHFFRPEVPKPIVPAVFELKLGGGALCTMEGQTQRLFQHRVPRARAGSTSIRVNLTWRWITNHSRSCRQRSRSRTMQDTVCHGIEVFIRRVQQSWCEGKARLLRFYYDVAVDRQKHIVQGIYRLVSTRADDSCCCFVEDDTLFGPDHKIIYRHFATLYFIFVADGAESELGVLDLIQVFVQVLDNCFENVCELDLIYHFDRVNYILDEIVMAGMVLETNADLILKAVKETKQLEQEGSTFGF